jgi:hypothetical protein
MMNNLSYICINNGIKAREMNRKIIWNTAGIAGLALGAVSTACMFAGQYMSMLRLSTGVSTLTGMILWIAETGTCIWLMSFFMKKMVAENEGIRNSETFKMGMATALLSGLILSAMTFANISFISADYYTENIYTLIQQMSSTLDSNSTAALERIMDNLPQISFFSTLIQCFIFGTIVSAVLSRSIPGKDPFADYKPDEQ